MPVNLGLEMLHWYISSDSKSGALYKGECGAGQTQVSFKIRTAVCSYGISYRLRLQTVEICLPYHSLHLPPPRQAEPLAASSKTRFLVLIGFQRGNQVWQSFHNKSVCACRCYRSPGGHAGKCSLSSDFLRSLCRASVLVGAPKANTSQPDIIEGGAVYYCPWPSERSAQCKQIPFDTTSK